jgi:hypothetical protein
LVAQGDWAAARRCFVEALAVSKAAQIAPVVLDALLGMAIVRAQEGAPEAALELVLHILQDPAGSHTTHARAAHLRADLTVQLADDQIAAIDARVGDTTLDSLTQNLLSGF